jgi:hypothetical protein
LRAKTKAFGAKGTPKVGCDIPATPFQEGAVEQAESVAIAGLFRLIALRIELRPGADSSERKN